MIVRQLINELIEYPLDMVVQIELYNGENSLKSSISATYRDEDNPNKHKQCVLIYGDDV